MRSAIRVTISTFGAFAGIAGIEHGIGEVLQGNHAPSGRQIASWPDAELFRILGGEPAMTIIPNLRLTGILAILVSLLFLVWAICFIERRNGGLLLSLLAIVMLLLGGGFGPPLLGFILGLAGTQLHSRFGWWRSHLSLDTRRLLGNVWPWSFAAGVTLWLLLFPGTILVGALFGINSADPLIPTLLYTLILAAFGLLFLTILTGCARDSEQARAK